MSNVIGAVLPDETHDEGTTSNENNDGSSSCTLFLAKSTIEQAGLGVFTAKPLKKGDHVGNGDACIPLKDLEWQQADMMDSTDFKFINPFADYVWLGDPLGLKPEIGPFQLVSGYWPGLNAAVNCHPAMLNVERATPRYDNLDDTLHRFKDPSVGSFTPYFNGSSTVLHSVPVGGELFTSYGDKWFERRLEMFPPNFPVPSSYRSAQRFLQRFQRHIPSPRTQQLVYDFVLDLEDIWEDSRFLQALPNDLGHVHKALTEGLRSLFQESSTRSIDWLQEHGACLDNIEAKRSTIRQAGRGAFATRHLVKDQVITISPLIHMLDSKLLDMHRFDFNMETKSYTKHHPMPPQLVMNYCFGHSDTKLLLCPYGSGVNYINHQNSSIANVRIAWPEDGVLNHKAAKLDDPVSQWNPEDKKSVLAFEYIATRDISPGEELFLDYGPDWEEAYAQHVQNWNPPHDYADYISATSWNDQHKRQDILKTPAELEIEPNPPSLQLRCHGGLTSAWGFKYHALKWDNDPDKYNPEYGHACQVLDRKEEIHGEITYDVLITEIIEDDDGEIVDYERRNVPRNCMKWFDKPESTDMHLPNSFRHSIGIPDDIFPDAWRSHNTRDDGHDPSDRQDDDNSSNQEPVCGMYIANSTIPKSGLGLFTGFPLEVGDEVGDGDVAIMLLELDWHNAKAQDEEDDENVYPDMTSNYVWDGRTFGFGNEAIGGIHTFWPGINAAVNFNPFLVNVDNEAIPEFDNAGIHRGRHPGAGAFSPYHKGIPHAQRRIPTGGELFKDYGQDWFHDRQQPYMPTLDDIQDAQYLLYDFFNKFGDQSGVYNLIIDIRNIWPSRLLNALPEKYGEAAIAALGEIADVFQPNATREIEWLQEHGRCVDHIVPGVSTLPNAGHGAFTKRFIPEGTIISGSPLLHMFEDVLEMYDLVYSDSTGARRKPWSKSGYQLLLNYCFGHHESSLLLCPYGPGVNYINHNSTMANVKIQWAPHGVTGQNNSWFSMAPKDMQWNYKQSLALDYVATKDIPEGAELFLDYGPLWEMAWKEHLLTWTPKDRWLSYLSAATMNMLMKQNPLRTQGEQRDSPYPANVMFQCDRATVPEIDYGSFAPINDIHPCIILERYKEGSGVDEYVVRMQVKGEEEPEIHNLSREAIKFYDRPYTSDLHLRSSFRHRIGFPEGMVPNEWRDSESSLFFANIEDLGAQVNDEL
ncbi:unnamed protein product [Cylindrotheca closterium]|uniref:SET domain-containing protein n=1 Tax=Cylindrotheca closterium TaxID=2856 RepID=A0AAD2CE94_9STRA|nr:unnamed protein product [Cylindrotheca closterium]